MHLYEMKLHDEVELKVGPSEYRILRVPGGWIYYNPRLDQRQMNSTFVPFDNEFQKESLNF